MAWSGFSEKQIKMMKEDTQRESSPSSRGFRGGRGSAKRGRGSGGRGRGPSLAQRREVSADTALPAEQRLAPPRQQEVKEGPQTPHKVPGEPSRPEEKAEDGPVDTETKDSPPEAKEAELNILEDEEGQQRELTKLQQLQEEQKLMEAGNKKKKALLYQALANRKKKTQEEVKRLAFVQRELTDIESLLTSDVSILRDKIEEASRLFTDAEKRYKSAEKEFVEAKMNLHKMEEKKEALTEHLFTIIHQNEQRKAKKLEELVSSLDADDMDLLSDNLPGAQVPLSAAQSEPLDVGETPHRTPEEGGKSQDVDSEIVVVGERAPGDGASPCDIASETLQDVAGSDTIPLQEMELKEGQHQEDQAAGGREVTTGQR